MQLVAPSVVFIGLQRSFLRGGGHIPRDSVYESEFANSLCSEASAPHVIRVTNTHAHSDTLLSTVLNMAVAIQRSAHRPIYSKRRYFTPGTSAQSVKDDQFMSL
jgi:hypothetical protein